MAILNPDGGTFALNDAASQLLGPDATSAANQLYSSNTADPTQVRSAVNDLFTSAGTAAQDTAQAQAQGITAEGDQQEANSYLTASGIADSNARLERASGGVQQAQEDRSIYKTLSGQASDIAGAGFNGDSLSALYLHADSAHQGQLAKSLLGTQTEITAGGFEQQSAAAKAEAQAAQTAAAAASTLEGQAASTGAMLQTNALNNALSFLGTSSDGTSSSTKGSAASGGYNTGTVGASGMPETISVNEAASDAAILNTDQNAIQISPAGKLAAQQYNQDVASGKIKPVEVTAGHVKIGNAPSDGGVGDTTNFARNNLVGVGG